MKFKGFSAIFCVYLLALCQPIWALTCPQALKYDFMSMAVPGGEPLEMMKTDGVFGYRPGEVGELYGLRLLQGILAQDFSAVRRVLIIGTGTGYEAVVLGRKFPHIQIDAIDIDPMAVTLTRLNAAHYGLQDRVRAVEGNLFVGAEGVYDLIVFHAPRPIYKKNLLKLFDNNPIAVKSVFNNRVLRHPEKFDPEGRLLKQTLAEFPHYLADNGSLLLMSEENLPEALPDGTQDIRLSTDPWIPGNTTEGNFSIHLLKMK